PGKIFSTQGRRGTQRGKRRRGNIEKLETRSADIEKRGGVGGRFQRRGAGAQRTQRGEKKWGEVKENVKSHGRAGGMFSGRWFRVEGGRFSCGKGKIGVDGRGEGGENYGKEARFFVGPGRVSDGTERATRCAR
ncbi:MAG: hypothetical protein IK066_04930, partial [Kiritimatiellae bacterium]|nr:hypothetical protein [Kiritimatiellia bacterium]